MPHSLLTKRGVIAARLLLEQVKAISASLFESESFSSDADFVMLLAGIFVGQAESRPMTAGKLSSYIGMPRGSVVRKLAKLADHGVAVSDAKGRWTLKTDDQRVAQRIAYLCFENSERIHRASEELSRLDTPKIAKRDAKELQVTRRQSR